MVRASGSAMPMRSGAWTGTGAWRVGAIATVGWDGAISAGTVAVVAAVSIGRKILDESGTYGWAAGGRILDGNTKM